ncbi:MAG: response regulator [Proteobacteria bacterium]|nr:MAG: response regulator [Pseudomonadota bacterium]
MSDTPASTMKKLILVVEDNVSESWALARLLRQAGFHSFECRTLKEGRAALRTKPDVIVLDKQLSDGNGFDFCRELKFNQVTAEIPVILVWDARDSEADPSQSISSGAHSFFSKPLNRPELLETIFKILWS